MGFFVALCKFSNVFENLYIFKVPMVTPIYYCDLTADSGLHSKSSVLAVSCIQL